MGSTQLEEEEEEAAAAAAAAAARGQNVSSKLSARLGSAKIVNSSYDRTVAAN